MSSSTSTGYVEIFWRIYMFMMKDEADDLPWYTYTLHAILAQVWIK